MTPVRRIRQLRYITARTIAIHPIIQREIIPAWVDYLIENFDIDAMGTLICVLGTDGHIYVIDGQHRLSALMALGYEEFEVPCEVREDNVSQERLAEIWRTLQKRRPASPYADWEMGVKANVQWCLDVKRSADAAGVAVRGSQQKGAASCIRKMQKVVEAEYGCECLTAALRALRRAYGGIAIGFDGILVAGISKVFIDNDEVDDDHLVEVLSKYPGGAAGLIGRARGLADEQPGTLGDHVAAIVKTKYNVRRTKNALA